jgi:outer membrane receptor protein involved in Fe transport
MTNTSRTLRHAVRFTLAGLATTVGGPLALAQTAPAASTAPAPSVQEVVVTGSRIQQAPNDVSISPVTSVTSVEIQQSGLLRTEDLLNSLPQVTAEFSSGMSISSNGTATVSLRDLGSQRTLVLINGRRMNPGAGLGTAAQPDIDQIPADLIERVDVLTGGASAVYGADAVAGVVNFVLNTHYDGVKLDANYGFYNHSNNNSTDLGYLSAFGAPTPPGTVDTAQQKDVSFVAGSNFADGKGNATVYFTYLNAGSAVGYQFDYAGCTLNTPSTIPGLATGHLACGGSGTSGHGQFLMLGNVIPPGKTTPVVSTIVDRAVDPSTGAFRPYNPAVDDYNYGALSYFQRPAERYTAGAFLNYEINDHVDAYSEFMFSRNTSQAQYGPSGDFFQLATISCADPLLTAQEVSVLCNPTTKASNQAAYGLTGNQISLYIARRNVEGGGRQDNYSSDSFREVLGLKGKIDSVWSYDVYGQVGVSQLEDIEGNFVGTPQITNALNVVTNPANGQPVCQSVLSGTDTTCVPYNIWKPNSITAQQLAYLTVPSTYTNKAIEYIASGSVTGDLGKYGLQVPTAASGVVVNVGAEYREEEYQFAPDYIFANGFEGGGDGIEHAILGEFHVGEAFTEIHVPLVDEKPGFYQLSAEGGYRYSSYTEGFDTNTFKLGLEWAPIQDVRIRGSYNRAIRAPSIDELFAPVTVGAGGVADPCWGANPSLTLAQCELTHVTPGQYGHITVNAAAQINTAAGGNTGLTPEIADTYAFGFVIQPQALPNFSMSVDYYDIKIKNTITELASTTVLDGCATTGDPTLCGLIHRGPSGSLWLSTSDYVSTTEQNIGDVATKGIDVKVHYRWDVGAMGKLTFDLNGTHVESLTTQPLPGGGSFDCAGYWGATCGAPLPSWRHNFSTNWLTPWAGLDVTLKWRYIGGSDVDASSTNPQLAGAYFPGTAHIGSYSYFDLSASMPLTSGVSMRIGVNNIADKDPPLVPNGTFSNCPNTTCNDNTWVGTYDTLGRYLYAHISAKF